MVSISQDLDLLFEVYRLADKVCAVLCILGITLSSSFINVPSLCLDDIVVLFVVC